MLRAMSVTMRRRLLLGFYSFVLFILAPLTLYHLVWRGFRQREYLLRWSERYAQIDALPALTHAIWIHAVSVGEVNAAAPLIDALLERYPQRDLLITTITPTGSARVAALWGVRVHHVYLPYDLRPLVRRFLDRVQPALGIIVETELWPNLFCEAGDRGIPLIVANARLSEKSLKGYRPLRPLLGVALDAVTLIAAQSQADAQRFVALGAAPDSVNVTGNLKFDLSISDDLLAQAQQWRRQWQRPQVWIAASTHPEEEEAVLSTFQQLRGEFPQLLLLWAPRHPERFAAVAQRACAAGYITQTRSEQRLPNANCQVFVIDTLGELVAFIAASDVAFVGGSLQPIGGHNVLEAAAVAVPVVVGPHMHNFVEATDVLAQANALIQIHSAEQLTTTMAGLLADLPAARARGLAGQARMLDERGALERTLALLTRYLPNTDGHDRHNHFTTPIV